MGALTLAVGARLLQEKDLGALEGKERADIAGDVLLLHGLGLAAGAGVGFDYRWSAGLVMGMFGTVEKERTYKRLCSQ
jgi:hypothetical protein